jgi:hypothetical protein
VDLTRCVAHADHTQKGSKRDAPRVYLLLELSHNSFILGRHRSSRVLPDRGAPRLRRHTSAGARSSVSLLVGRCSIYCILCCVGTLVDARDALVLSLQSLRSFHDNYRRACPAQQLLPRGYTDKTHISHRPQTRSATLRCDTVSTMRPVCR